jgi:hypothetical protein
MSFDSGEASTVDESLGMGSNARPLGQETGTAVIAGAELRIAGHRAAGYVSLLAQDVHLHDACGPAA